MEEKINTKEPIDLPEQKYLLECLKYDPENGYVYWKWRPREHFKSTANYNNFIKNRANKIISNKHRDGYLRLKLDGVEYRLHRVIWKLYHGEDPKYFIDHINGVRDDNRIENLREATSIENVRNINKLVKRNTSGYVGVSFCTKRKRYRTSIRYEGRSIHIGEFKDLNEARTRRVLLEKALYKEFYAKTDDIEDSEYYKKYVDNLSKEELIEYTTISDIVKTTGKPNRTGFIGVNKDKSGKYRGYIRIGTKTIYTTHQKKLL